MYCLGMLKMRWMSDFYFITKRMREGLTLYNILFSGRLGSKQEEPLSEKRIISMSIMT